MKVAILMGVLVGVHPPLQHTNNPNRAGRDPLDLDHIAALHLEDPLGQGHGSADLVDLDHIAACLPRNSRRAPFQGVTDFRPLARGPSAGTCFAAARV